METVPPYIIVYCRRKLAEWSTVENGQTGCKTQRIYFVQILRALWTCRQAAAKEGYEHDDVCIGG